MTDFVDISMYETRLAALETLCDDEMAAYEAAIIAAQALLDIETPKIETNADGIATLAGLTTTFETNLATWQARYAEIAKQFVL